ncbi:hypothetical protein LTR74_005651 [Friedmanniomyces endolithicus]|nr:hypothetical protein LTR74_005651 [Friedmanniomyces endolithicus]
MSSIPDYRKLLEDLAKEIEASKKKLNLDAVESEADVQVPVQPLAVPDYKALRNGLSERWKKRSEKNSIDAIIEMMCHADVLLARLAVLTEYMRIEKAEDDRTNGIEKVEKLRMQLSTIEDGMVRLERVLQMNGKALKHVRPLHKWDARLSDLAMDTVSRERFEEQLAVYQSRVKDDDVQGWQTVYEMQIELQQRLMIEAERTAQVFSLDMYSSTTVGDEVVGGQAWMTAWKNQALELRKLYRNIAMAVFGGMTLLVPMLIMVLYPGITTVLVTTSVSVLVVAVALATIMSAADVKEIVVATSAYAAVLVVFVGSSVGSGNSTGSGDGSSQGTGLGATGAIGGIVVGSICGTLVLLSAIAMPWYILAWKLPQWIDLPMPVKNQDRLDKKREEKLEKGDKLKASLAPPGAGRRARDFEAIEAERGKGAKEVKVETATNAQLRDTQDDKSVAETCEESV